MKRNPRQRGLTLLEALVTLVITSMVAGLMAEGLFQLARIEQRLSTGQLQARLERLHLVWLQQALEGMRAGELSTPDALRGTRRRLEGVSSLLPLSEHVGPMAVTLSMVYRRELDQTELVLDVPEASPPVEAAVLARWRKDAGHFSYLHPNGEWLSDWPTDGAAAPLLPKAIAVHGEGGGLLVVAALQASPQALGKRQDMGKLP